MRLPTEIRIGPAIYEVKRLEMEDDLGNCDSATNTIKIDSKLSPDRTRATFLHEILHAMAHEFNADIPRKSEEAMVRAIESGLLVLSYDNPDILKEIFKL